MDFFAWCADKKLSLPTTDENVTRAGIRGTYPDAYVRGQYPKGYFSPTSATAFLDLKNAEGTKHVKDAGNTPLK